MQEPTFCFVLTKEVILNRNLKTLEIISCLSNTHLIYFSINPFERETTFRQSISEKRRLNQHANNHAVQWKQLSFQDNRTNSERSKLKSTKTLHIYI